MGSHGDFLVTIDRVGQNMAIFYPFLEPNDAITLLIILVFCRQSDSLSTVFRAIRSFSAVHKVTAVASLRLELKVLGEPIGITSR